MGEAGPSRLLPFIRSGNMPLDLSVIITTYNSSSTLKSTLSSLENLVPEEKPMETIVVDNCSSDGSAEVAESFERVRVIRSSRNMGLARANNLGASRATGSSLLFLNPDTEVRPGALSAMADFEVFHRSAALIGPAMEDASGNRVSTARTWPTPLDIALRRTFLGKLPGARKRLRKHLFPVDGRHPARVDWISGAAIWATRTGLSGVGLMSERYFLYFEDVQWCMRAARSGMEVWYVPDAVITHEGRRESAGPPGRALWLHLASMVRFFIEYPCAMVGRCFTDKRDRSH